MISFRNILAAAYEHVRLGHMTPGARRGLLYLLVLGVAVNLAAFWLSARSVNDIRVQQLKLHAAVLNLCQFNADLGNAAASPVTLNPMTHKASPLGIQILADSRAAWRGLGCPGRLEAPSPSFSHWARAYHLPAD